MDFASDALFDGRRIRALTLTDDYGRESLAIEVGQSITGEQVVAVMKRMAQQGGTPKIIRVDNGPEFVSRAIDQWVYLHQVTLDFSCPGKPTDNAMVDSFNGRLRDEFLNTTGSFPLTTPGARSKLGASTRTRVDSHFAGLRSTQRLCATDRRERRHMNPDYPLRVRGRNRDPNNRIVALRYDDANKGFAGHSMPHIFQVICTECGPFLSAEF